MKATLARDAASSGHQPPRWCLLIGFVAVCAVACVPALTAPAAATSEGGTVVIYGDSIVHAAAPIIRQSLSRYGITLVDASVGGTAPCDALQFVGSDMARYNPELVVIAYVGNALSPCINGTTGEDVYIRHYLDTKRLINAIGDRPILLDTAPGNIGQSRYTPYYQLVEYEASRFRAQVADTSAALIDPATHEYQKTMPCRPLIKGCKRVDVRGPDGYHLTPVGAFLYARVATTAILKRLDVPARQPG
jgi:hypothetical protein